MLGRFAPEAMSSSLEIFDDMADVTQTTDLADASVSGRLSTGSTHPGVQLPDKENCQPNDNLDASLEADSSADRVEKPHKVGHVWEQACELRKLQEKLAQEERLRNQAEACATDKRNMRKSMMDVQSQLQNKEKAVEELQLRMQQLEASHREDLCRSAIAQDQALTAKELEAEQMKVQLTEQAARLRELEPLAAEAEYLRADNGFLRLRADCSDDEASSRTAAASEARMREAEEKEARLNERVMKLEEYMRKCAHQAFLNEQMFIGIAEQRRLSQAQVVVASSTEADRDLGCELHQLQAIVDRLREENSELKADRDRWAEHATYCEELMKQQDLGGHMNQRQKIQHLIKVKQDYNQSVQENGRLRNEIRKLQKKCIDLEEQVQRQRSSPSSSKPQEAATRPRARSETAAESKSRQRQQQNVSAVTPRQAASRR